MTTNETVSMQALRAASQARIPVMLVGAPGIGKTAKIRQLAEDIGYRLITLIGSQMDPTDITGLPKGEIVMHDEDGNPVWGTVNLAPDWQVRIMQQKKIVLFLDEFSNTSPSVRASMLTLLQNREFPNGQSMPDETIIIGAMNPTDSAADGWELDKPTTNRMLFLAWESPKSEWIQGMLSAWGKDVSKEEMGWRKRIVSFIEDNPTFLHKEAEEVGSSDALGVASNDSSRLEVLRYAWASRRSWDNLAHALSFVDPTNTVVVDEIAAGLVGKSATNEFREWQQKNSVMSPEDVLDNPKDVDWKTIEVSTANILFRAITDMADHTNWDKVANLINAVADDGCEALISGYIQDIIQHVIAAVRQHDPKKFDDARAALMGAIKRYGTLAKK